MLKRPSSRRKSNKEQIQLNLVPILDAMVTLIGFLLFTMSFLVIVGIETPFPEASRELQKKIKEKPLQLTVSLRDKDLEIWSPFEKIKPKTIQNISPGQPDIKQLHESLIAIKQQFMTENKVVLAPSGGISYDTIIAVMDSMRELDKTDPPLFLKNPVTGIDEPLKKLFPEVIFGNLLGNS